MLYNSELKSLQDREEISITDMLDHQPLVVYCLRVRLSLFFSFFVLCYFQKISRNEN